MDKHIIFIYTRIFGRENIRTIDEKYNDFILYRITK